MIPTVGYTFSTRRVRETREGHAHRHRLRFDVDALAPNFKSLLKRKASRAKCSMSGQGGHYGQFGLSRPTVGHRQSRVVPETVQNAVHAGFHIGQPRSLRCNRRGYLATNPRPWDYDTSSVIHHLTFLSTSIRLPRPHTLSVYI